MNKSLLLAATLSLALLIALPNQAKGQEEKQNYIEITGKAEREITPDRIYLTIRINENSYKNKSLAEVEKNMIDGFAQMGIDTKKNLVVKDIASNFKYYLLKGNSPKLSKEYELLTTDAKMAGKVIVMLQSIGISSVSISKIENSKIEEYENEVRVEAVKNAKQKAILLAEAIDQKIGKAIYIAEVNEYGMTPVYALSTMTRGIKVSNSDEYEAPDIEFENITIKESVSVRFELQ